MMNYPISRLTSCIIVLVIALTMNHDFIDGSYSGPYWFRPFDFVLTQLFVALVAWRIYVSQVALEKEQ